MNILGALFAGPPSHRCCEEIPVYPGLPAEKSGLLIYSFLEKSIQALNCQINSAAEDNFERVDEVSCGVVSWYAVYEVPCVGVVCGVVWCWCVCVCVRDVLYACCVWCVRCVRSSLCGMCVCVSVWVWCAVCAVCVRVRSCAFV